MSSKAEVVLTRLTLNCFFSSMCALLTWGFEHQKYNRKDWDWHQNKYDAAWLFLSTESDLINMGVSKGLTSKTAACSFTILEPKTSHCDSPAGNRSRKACKTHLAVSPGSISVCSSQVVSGFSY